MTKKEIRCPNCIDGKCQTGGVLTVFVVVASEAPEAAPIPVPAPPADTPPVDTPEAPQEPETAPPAAEDPAPDPEPSEKPSEPQTEPELPDPKTEEPDRKPAKTDPLDIDGMHSLDWQIDPEDVGRIVRCLNHFISKHGHEAVNRSLADYGVTIGSLNNITPDNAEKMLVSMEKALEEEGVDDEQKEPDGEPEADEAADSEGDELAADGEAGSGGDDGGEADKEPEPEASEAEKEEQDAEIIAALIENLKEMVALEMVSEVGDTEAEVHAMDFVRRTLNRDVMEFDLDYERLNALTKEELEKVATLTAAVIKKLKKSAASEAVPPEQPKDEGEDSGEEEKTSKRGKKLV